MTRFARLRTPTDVAHLFVRRIGTFLLVSGAAVAAIGAFGLTRIPLYSSTSQLQIDTDREAPVSPDLAARNNNDGATVAAVRRLGSRATAERVVDKLGLSGDEEFNGTARGMLSSISSSRPLDDAARHADAVRALMSDLVVTRVEDAPIVSIEATSRDRFRAAQIVNAVAEDFLATGRAERRAAAGEQAATLGRQLDRLGAEARAADADLARYRAQHGLVQASPAGSNPLDQQTASLAADLAAAQSDMAAAQSRSAAAGRLAADGRPDAVSEVLVSPVMTELRKQRAEIAARADEIRVRYGKDHPQTKRVSEQLAGIDASIREEQQRIAAGLRSAAAAAFARSGAVAAELAGLQARQAEKARASVEADSLARIADAKRTTYGQLAQSALRSAQEHEIGAAPGWIIVAGVPADRPVYPNKMLLVAMALIVGPAAGTIAVLVAEAFDSKIIGSDELVVLPGVRHLTSVGQLSPRTLHQVGGGTRPWDYVLARPMSSFAESIRSVRARLISSREPGVGQVVCVTSALSNEGKSTLAASLSRTMALAGDRVLLVDCDLRRNGLAGFVETAPELGLFEVLAGQCEFRDAILQDTAPGLDVLPLKQPSFTPRDMFGGGAMARLVERLRPLYDFVILDAPPVLVVQDSIILASVADRMLLAVRWGSTRAEALKIAVERLREEVDGVIGVILTGVDPRSRAGIGYRDQSYYMATASGYHVN